MMSSSHQRDTTFTKIFVGGLPYHTTDQTLQKYFEPFGNIDEAVVITDRQTGKSRGYGFVTMSDRAAAERACKDPNPIIDGRKANVNLAYLGAKPRIPVGELIAALPLGLKPGPTGASYLAPEIMGYPQLIYPSTYLSTIPHGGQLSLAQPQIITGSINPGTQLIDYPTVLGTTQPYPTSALSLYQDAAKLAAYPYITAPAASGMGYLGASSTPPAGAAALATYPPMARSGLVSSPQTFIGQFVSTKALHPQQIQDRL